MDPALLATLSALGGATLTAGAGVLGAFVQRRQEHQKWLREQRYEVHREFLTAVDVDRHHVRIDAPDAQPYGAAPGRDSVQVLVSRSALLGPPELHEAARSLQGALVEWLDTEDDEALLEVRRQYIGVCQRILRLGTK